MSACVTQELVEAVRNGLIFARGTMTGPKADSALTELAERLEAAEQESKLLKALDEIEPVAELRVRAEAAESLNAELAHLLHESYGWMNGVEPKPAEPFLDEIRAALTSLEALEKP